jgi:peptidoglycan DL-endopeptidase CwlO
MSEGLAAVQSRIAEIQDMLGVRPASTAATSSASGTAFASALADASSGTTTATATGGDAVSVATRYLGVPYRWGGTDPDTGLDCSGLTQLVYQQLGVELPRTSAEQAKAGTEVASLDDAKPGDLVFFGSPVHHVGIYVGDGKMLDAPHSGAKVRIEDVWGTPSAIRRVIPPSTTSSPATGAAALAGLSLNGLSVNGLSLNGLTSSGLTSGGVTSGGVTSGGLAGLSSAGTSGPSSPYANLFAASGAKYGVDPALLSAVAKAESSYRPSAVSPAGARGLMQLMPGTARELGVNPDVPAQAVDGAAKLLSNHLRSFNGRVDLALAAYNAGAGAVRKYGGIPPFTETQNYVRKVTGYWGDLR